MTLIGIQVDAKKAVMVTDTFSYAPLLRNTGETTKVLPLMHLDAMSASRGSSDFGVAWDLAVTVETMLNPDFDTFLAAAPEIARGAWAAVEKENLHGGEQTAAYLVGYSRARASFCAYAFCFDRDFEPEELVTPHLIPAPADVSITDIEARWLAPAEAAATGASVEDVEAEINAWRSERSLEDAYDLRAAAGWVKACVKAREHRSVLAKTCVHGRLIYSKMQRGKFSSHVVHEWGDDEHYRNLVADTLHPIAQAAPCYCGSGLSFRDCHIEKAIDDPCLCDSGKPMGGCCAVFSQGLSSKPTAASIR